MATMRTKRGSAAASQATPNSGVPRLARVAVTALIGGSLALIGAALLFLPGPGWLFIGAGLSILAAEFSWSRRWLRRLERDARRGLEWVRSEEGGAPSVDKNPSETAQGGGES
jgi:hypothetical protein